MKALNSRIRLPICLLVLAAVLIVCAIGGASAVDYVFVTVLSFSFVQIALYDIRFHLIKNKSLLLICLFKILWMGLGGAWWNDALYAVKSLVVVSLLLLVIGMLLPVLNLSVGAGDYKYIAALSFCLGIKSMLRVVVFALIASLISFFALRRNTKSSIAMAPYLSFGAIVSLLAAVLR